MKRLVIIDGKSVLYRGYYAMGNLSMSDGTPTGGVYGFAAMLLEILEDLKPDYVAVAWDKSKTNIRKRKEIYSEYKSGRKAAPEDFYAQIPYLMEMLTAFHIPLYEYDDYEADDIMGALARKATAKMPDLQVDLVSSDLDMLQIVGERVDMYRLKKGFSDVEKFNIAAVERKYGLGREQFLDFKALKGDSSDNIPGVPGIGEKGAIALLQKWESLDDIYDHIEEIDGKIGEKLRAGKKLAYVSRKLAAIMFDAPVKFRPEEMDVTKMDPEKVLEVFRKLEFRSLVRRFEKARVSASSENPSGEALGQPDFLTGETRQSEKPVAKVFSGDSSGLFLSWDVKRAMHEDEEVAGKVLSGERFWDLGQGAFLLNPLVRGSDQVSLTTEDVLRQEYHRQMEEFEKLPKLYWVADNLDMPLIPILYKMEEKGVKIDSRKFAELKTEFGSQAKEIEQKIYTMAGHEFNVNSPMQLSEVLYGELKLPTAGVKKKQRFYSTGQKELDKLRELHPIIELIERMREVTKLLSTYVEPLPNLVDENGRVHTTYTQNVTATGRLSSVSPNLQNIPVRTDEGRRIREGFVADEGKVYVSADYAQFELRLAAALAGDARLISDFNSGVDIHTKTASDVFSVSMDKVTKEQRRVAKVINFGVLYGMSAKGLSEAAGMTIGGAKEFIDKYFALRKPIREYLDEILEQARSRGYVETIFGRRRPTPDVKARNYVVRAAAERAAMNMPIQGTEADLMKLAMLAVDRGLPKGADLILQVHDSLIVECEKGLADEVGGVLKQAMEGVAPELPVKLLVEVSTGKNWGEL
jgi:DNA polymerase-1